MDRVTDTRREPTHHEPHAVPLDDRLDRNRITNQFDSRRMQDRMDQRHQMMDGEWRSVWTSVR